MITRDTELSELSELPRDKNDDRLIFSIKQSLEFEGIDVTYVNGVMTYEALKRQVQQLQAEGRIPRELTPTERADWAYGNAVIENDQVTREMAERAVAAQRDKR